MMWVSAFGGIMKSIDAFRPLSTLLIKISKNVRQLMFWNGVLSIVGNMTLADEMAQIVTVGPIIRKKCRGKSRRYGEIKVKKCYI